MEFVGVRNQLEEPEGIERYLTTKERARRREGKVVPEGMKGETGILSLGGSKTEKIERQKGIKESEDMGGGEEEEGRGEGRGSDCKYTGFFGVYGSRRRLGNWSDRRERES